MTGTTKDAGYDSPVSPSAYNRMKDYEYEKDYDVSPLDPPVGPSVGLGAPPPLSPRQPEVENSASSNKFKSGGKSRRHNEKPTLKCISGGFSVLFKVIELGSSGFEIFVRLEAIFVFIGIILLVIVGVATWNKIGKYLTDPAGQMKQEFKKLLQGGTQEVKELFDKASNKVKTEFTDASNKVKGEVNDLKDDAVKAKNATQDQAKMVFDKWDHMDNDIKSDIEEKVKKMKSDIVPDVAAIPKPTKIFGTKRDPAQTETWPESTIVVTNMGATASPCLGTIAATVTVIVLPERDLALTSDGTPRARNPISWIIRPFPKPKLAECVPKLVFSCLGTQRPADGITISFIKNNIFKSTWFYLMIWGLVITLVSLFTLFLILKEGIKIHKINEKVADTRKAVDVGFAKISGAPEVEWEKRYIHTAATVAAYTVLPVTITASNAIQYATPVYLPRAAIKVTAFISTVTPIPELAAIAGIVSMANLSPSIPKTTQNHPETSTSVIELKPRRPLSTSMTLVPFKRADRMHIFTQNNETSLAARCIHTPFLLVLLARLNTVVQAGLPPGYDPRYRYNASPSTGNQTSIASHRLRIPFPFVVIARFGTLIKAQETNSQYQNESLEKKTGFKFPKNIKRDPKPRPGTNETSIASHRLYIPLPFVLFGRLPTLVREEVLVRETIQTPSKGSSRVYRNVFTVSERVREHKIVRRYQGSMSWANLEKRLAGRGTLGPGVPSK
jgi:F0F1-type ATP synthase membrane subunit b/b'